MVPVMTSTDGRCVAIMMWMPAARAICARRCTAASMSLPATSIRSAISSTTTTISGSGSVGSGSSSKRGAPGLGIEAGLHAVRQDLALGARLLEALVVALDIAHAELGHGAIAAFHLAHGPFQRDDRLLRLGHDRAEQMRDAVIHRQLQHLRVDHDEAAFVGRQPIEQRQDHRVDADRLAGAGGAGDQQMRHVREIGDHGRAADILAERPGRAARCCARKPRRRAARADRPSRPWRWAARCR